jgi:hypothetical protein
MPAWVFVACLQARAVFAVERPRVVPAVLVAQRA